MAQKKKKKKPLTCNFQKSAIRTLFEIKLPTSKKMKAYHNIQSKGSKIMEWSGIDQTMECVITSSYFDATIMQLVKNICIQGRFISTELYALS